LCTTIGTTRTQLRPAVLEIVASSEASVPKFFCQNCSEEVKDLKEIITTCNSCGSIESVENLERIFKNGAVVCKKCKDKSYKEDPSRTLIKIMALISLGQ
jgi:hypothetical protein